MKICVFCGSSSGTSDRYAAAARDLGRVLAEREIAIIYGGASVGLMGELADAALSNGGEVIGVMPEALIEREIAHPHLTQLVSVATMHERKAAMSEMCGGFIALPGGAGTLEEIVEQWTWAQLGIHAKPCAFLDVDDYYAPLKQMVARMVESGFLKAAYAEILMFETDIAAIIDGFETYRPPVRKWLKEDSELAKN